VELFQFCSSSPTAQPAQQKPRQMNLVILERPAKKLEGTADSQIRPLPNACQGSTFSQTTQQ